jgi:CHAT domain-containing protein
MGLTRAWIAAGARAVLATRWDVPDDTAQSLMVNFYRALRRSDGGSPALALRAAQLQALHGHGPDAQPSRWAGYFLLSRI